MIEKLAKLLRTKPEVFQGLPQDVLGRVIDENNMLVRQTLAELGLSRNCVAEEITHVLVSKLLLTDQHLKILSRDRLLEKAQELAGKPQGFFIKRKKAFKLLEKFLPDESVNADNLTSILCSLRFRHDNAWMHRFFDEAYRELTPDDFETRAVELKILEPHWLNIAAKFTKHKLHNVSHLKEFGIIFVLPDKQESPGETLRTFMLLLHYLKEVPFYSRLFQKIANEPDFIPKLQYLLRGDVSNEKRKTKNEKYEVRIVQRYLAKDDIHDWRLLEPHVNPEAEHWYKAEGDLERIAHGEWQKLDFVGDYFPSKHGGEKLVSFGLIDLNMELAEAEHRRFYYHQQEALWNKIFIEYLGRDRLNQLIEENIISGFIVL